MNIFKPKSKTILTKRINLYVPSRTMVRFSGLISKVIPATVNNTQHHIPKHPISYTVEKNTFNNSSFEVIQNNPIIQGKKSFVFMHYGVAENVCTLDGCNEKLCSSLCADLKQKAQVGHFTHDGNREGSSFASDTDLNKKASPQFYKAHASKVVIPNEKNVDVQKTAEMNNNGEMVRCIHSANNRQPIVTPGFGSDDFSTNIN